MSKKLLMLFMGFSFLLFTSCSQGDTHKAREAWMSKDKEDIVIGLAYPIEVTESTTGFLNGINMALEEINETGILGKKISIVKKDDEGTVTTGAEVAQSFVDDPMISAVIGHWNSRVSIAVSDIYNSNKMVMITPASTSPLLTSKGYEYIFSTINDDIDYGETMANYATEEGLDKVVIYYVEDEYGRGLANGFEDAAYKNGIQVVDRITSINDRNIQDLIDRWNALDYNAIFIAGLINESVDVINIISDVGVQVPIMGATGLDRSIFMETMGIKAEGITMPTVFNPYIETDKVKTFVSDYEEKYGKQPDLWALQGYETVKILCYAIEKAGSPMPEDIAKALHEINDYSGTMGTLSCNPKGEILGNEIYVKMVKNGKYVFLGKY